MTEKQAKALRSVLVQGGESLSDAIISTTPEACRRMKYDGALIKNGTRVYWNGTVKRAAVDLWDREDQNPDNAPTLWEDVLYKDGIRIIPETITAGMLAVYRPIERQHAGTQADPIPWVSGMDCYAGKYYSYNGHIYRVADGGTVKPCVWYPGMPDVWQWEMVE